MLSRSALSSCPRRTRNAFHVASRSLATAVEASPAPTILPPRPVGDLRTKKTSPPVLNTAIILNRSPLITRTPTLFERAYFAYQQRIARALHNPFPFEFYFKQGSLLEARFNVEERRRERRLFGRGFGADSEPESTSATDQANADLLNKEEEEEAASRRHEADEKGDVKSLDRHGQRNLYLLLQKREGGEQVWAFPQGGVQPGEFLHQAAERDLAADCGPFMNTWIVSRNPIGVYKPQPSAPASRPQSPETHTFFYKAHIMAGQVTPDGKNVLDFAWLTKQEIESRVEKEYWLGVKDMLSDF